MSGPPGPTAATPGEDTLGLTSSPEGLAARTAPPAGHQPAAGARCLVTNDDGIASAGLRALVAVAVGAGLDTVVAAPMRNCSGASSSVNAVEAGGRFLVERRDWPGCEAVDVFAVDGLPAFIALTAARGAFGPPPEVVLSGVNLGPNTGYAILHSGTVGAALTASTHGCRAMAVSLAVGPTPEWDTAGAVAAELLPWLLAAPQGTVLNVNVPNVARGELTGIRQAGLARFGAVQVNVESQGEGSIQLSLAESDAEYEEGTDAAYLASGFATVSPLAPVCLLPELDVRAAWDGKARTPSPAAGEGPAPTGCGSRGGVGPRGG